MFVRYPPKGAGFGCRTLAIFKGADFSFMRNPLQQLPGTGNTIFNAGIEYGIMET
jgi:hypothetical protein